MCTKAVWTPRGLTRFTVLVLIHLASRRVQIAGISAEPDGPWVTQLMRNATDAEDGCLRHIRFLIHDRDPLFRPAVRDTLPPADVTPIRLPARSPNLNAYDELQLGVDEKRAAQAQLDTLNAQLTDTPNPVIVQEAGRTLRHLTEGAIGSLIAKAAEPKVWSWVSQVLAIF